jgi:hypothetical protein
MPTTKAIETKAKCTKCIEINSLQLKKKDEDNPLEKNRFLYRKIAKKCTLCEESHEKTMQHEDTEHRTVLVRRVESVKTPK